MEKIQWFPGHMHKAQKEVRERLSEVDVIIQVLDARIPHSSSNPMLETIGQDKPTIKILNKTDLADPERTLAWQTYLEQNQNIKTLAFNAQQADRKAQLLSLIQQMVPNKINHDENEVKTIHALIMGIPNVGKSTLINTLAGRTIARTGNEPAVTKTQQRIKLEDNITIFDTPGMLWPNIENIHSGYRLAISGGIKDTAFELPDIAAYAAEYFLEHYPDNLKKRFQLDALPDKDAYQPEIEFLDTIGKQRGCLKNGGVVDYDKIARILITEYRDNILGAMTLETPDIVEKELVQVAIDREERERKKQEKEERKKQKRGKRNR